MSLSDEELAISRFNIATVPSRVCRLADCSPFGPYGTIGVHNRYGGGEVPVYSGSCPAEETQLPSHTESTSTVNGISEPQTICFQQLRRSRVPSNGGISISIATKFSFENHRTVTARVRCRSPANLRPIMMI